MIRDLTEHDLDSFIRIREDSLKLDPMSFGASPFVKIDREETLQRLREKNESDFILGCFEDYQLVGITGFVRYKNVKTKHKAFIWGVFVYEAFRGKKIGETLMTMCISRARKLGLEKLLLGASHTSDAAIDLYKKLGFEEYGREVNAMKWENKYIDEVLFEIRL